MVQMAAPLGSQAARPAPARREGLLAGKTQEGDAQGQMGLALRKAGSLGQGRVQMGRRERVLDAVSQRVLRLIERSAGEPLVLALGDEPFSCDLSVKASKNFEVVPELLLDQAAGL